MRFLGEAHFLLTNCRPAEIPGAQSGCVMIKYTTCAAHAKTHLVAFRREFFEHSQRVPRTGRKPAKRGKKEERINTQPVFAKSPVASNQHFFLLHVGAKSALKQSQRFSRFFS